MAVRRGEPWGAPGGVPGDATLVRSDAEARAAVEAARRERRPWPVLGLLGGDLARTLGATGSETRLRGGEATRAEVDLGEALVDGRLHLFVAHAVVRGRTAWRGRVVAAMNAQFLGRHDVAPRAHPGDGLLDVLDVADSFPLGERWKAWRRLPSGTHVPHPAIEQRRVRAVQVDVPSGAHVWLDGTDVGPARTVSLRLEPDALTVVV